MSSAFHYPTFRRKTESFSRYLNRRRADLVALNHITDPQLSQLDAMIAAVNTVATSSGWPKYRELP